MSPPHTTLPLQNPPPTQLLGFILYYASLLLTLPLHKIHQLNKLALKHHSPPHVQSPKSPPHTTPYSLQNLPTTYALPPHSPPHVSSPMPPPHTTPTPQNPSKALRK
jgi:hypothetical protein